MRVRWCYASVVVMGIVLELDLIDAAQTCQDLAINPTAGLCTGKQLATKGCYDGTFSTAVLNSLKGLADTAASTNCKNFFTYDYCVKVSPNAKVVCDILACDGSLHNVFSPRWLKIRRIAQQNSIALHQLFGSCAWEEYHHANLMEPALQMLPCHKTFAATMRSQVSSPAAPASRLLMWILLSARIMALGSFVRMRRAVSAYLKPHPLVCPVS